MTVEALIIAVFAVGNIALWVFAAHDYGRLRRQYEDLAEDFLLLHREMFECGCATFDDVDAHMVSLLDG